MQATVCAFLLVVPVTQTWPLPHCTTGYARPQRFAKWVGNLLPLIVVFLVAGGLFVMGVTTDVSAKKLR